MFSAGPPIPTSRSTKLLARLRERIQPTHYSLRTEETCVYGCRAFFRLHGLGHPTDMGNRGGGFRSALGHGSPGAGIDALAGLFRLAVPVDGKALEA